MFVGKNIFLRAIEPEDIDALYLWENDTLLWGLNNMRTPVSKWNLKNLVEQAGMDIYEVKQQRFMIVLKANNQAIGAIDIFDFDAFHSRAGIGILIYDKNNRNKQLGSEALELIINYSFSFVKMKQLYCNILKSNTNSKKLFSNKGFIKTGVFKEWVWNGNEFEDSEFYQLFNPGYIG